MAKYKLLLPKMGESVAEATVIRWTKKPGDYIEADETVMEIATDKVDSDVPSPVAGTLIEQLCNDNDVIQVGAVIAVIETADPEEIIAANTTTSVHLPVQEDKLVTDEVPSPVEEIQQMEQETPAPVDEAPEPEAFAETSEPEPVVETAVPEIEKAEEKQPVFAYQREELSQPVPYTEQLEQSQPATEDTLKNSLRFYSPLVKNIAAQEGISNAELEKIPGTGAEGRLTKDDLLNYIQNRYQSATAIQDDVSEVNEAAGRGSFEPSNIAETLALASEPVIDTLVQEPTAEIAEPIVETPQPEQVSETPEPDLVAETTKPADEAPEPEPVIEKTQPEPAKQEPVARGTSFSGGDEIIEMDRMGRLIAEHMVMSKHTSPHVTSFVEADVTNLVLWREKIKNSFEKREGEKITFTPIFIEAVVRAIKDMPMINIQVNGTQIIKKKDINISMATALPSGNLIVPVIKRADELSLIGLTKAVNDLANRARTNKLKPDDVQGGTFTITNVGSFGNVMGTPIINQPQVAILAVGAIKKKPAVIETLQGDMIGIRHMMFLSLSYDHRVVNGAMGGSFVRRVADYLENWDPGREI